MPSPSPTASSSSTSNASRAAARGTLWSVALRLLSFLCTQITLRWVDPVALGKANIDLELAFGFILFLSREGFRLTLSKNWNLGLAYVTRLLHTVVALAAWMWLCGGTLGAGTSQRSSEDSSFDYRLSATLYCVAAWMEGWAEPRVLKTLYDLKLEHKVYAEGMATVTKTFATVIALWLLPDYPVTAFGIAQFGYALVYNVVLYYRVPSLDESSDGKSSSMFVALKNIDASLRNQVIIFTLQGIFKHALTEGDRIMLLLTIEEGYDKGLYALASAFGGMAARLLFQPLEENARLLWSKLVVQSEQEKKGFDKTLLLQSYTGLVKLVLYVGLIFAALGTNYTDILLQLLGGSAKRPAAPVLAAFCAYTLFMALNGMTEAFWYAAAGSGHQVAGLGLVHFLIGLVAYAALAPALVAKYGTVGLVASNVISMALRSLYALHFASSYFQQSFSSLVMQILPHPLVLLGFATTFLTTQWSLQHFLSSESQLVDISLSDPQWLKIAGQHVGVGIACLVGVASLVVALERPYFTSLRNLFREKRD